MHLLLLLATTAMAHAFRLEPMVLSIPVGGPHVAGTYSVENNSADKVAIQFDLRRRTTDREGNEDRPKAEGFLIYPQQMALEPGEKRSVRISWAGTAIPAQELPFRLVATQLPVSFDKAKSTGSNVRFLMEYVASLYLVPPGTKAHLKTISSTVNKKGQMEVVMQNDGTAHQLLDQMKIEAEAGGKKASPPKDELDELRTGNILPGEERVLRFTLPKGFPSDAKAHVQLGS